MWDNYLQCNEQLNKDTINKISNKVNCKRNMMLNQVAAKKEKRSETYTIQEKPSI